MKRPKRRAGPARPPAPVPRTPPELQFEKPFFFLVFGVAAASVMFAGSVFNLIRPYRPLTAGPALFLVVVAALSGWMAYQYGRAAAARVRKWRGRVSGGP